MGGEGGLLEKVGGLIKKLKSKPTGPGTVWREEKSAKMLIYIPTIHFSSTFSEWLYLSRHALPTDELETLTQRITTHTSRQYFSTSWYEQSS